jgi:hypothetical protein
MRRAIPVVLLLAASCLPRSSVPDEERQRVARELEGERRWFEVAVNVGPLFGDASKLLASDRPVSEVELLESPRGELITPPPAERVLPPGTPARITKVEFPTGWIAARRVLTTPRDRPWVYLEVPGEARPVVLVLPPDLKTLEAVRLELERWFAPVDPTPVLREFPEEHQRAIAAKRLTEDMAARAVQMSWGYPERKVIDRPGGTEEWSWSEGKRRAWFKDGKLLRWSPR